jgi:FkbM family methyltransferase
MIILTADTETVFTARDQSPTDALVVRETWVENVYRIGATELDDTGILLDLGANIGAVSVWGARLGSQAIAVEPDPDNRSYLAANLAANLDPDAYTVLANACTPTAGLVHLRPAHGDSAVVPESAADTVTVEGITLEEVYLRAGVPYSDVLKIDIEGGEYPLIAATPTEVLRKSRYITMEFDAAPDAVFGPLVAKLAHDFSIEVLGSPARGGYLYARRYDA